MGKIQLIAGKKTVDFSRPRVAISILCIAGLFMVGILVHSASGHRLIFIKEVQEVSMNP